MPPSRPVSSSSFYDAMDAPLEFRATRRVVQVPMLRAIADHLWVEARRLRFLGIETGTRMTVVGLLDDGLFVHSPVSLDEKTREAIDALGRVKAIVAPSLFHHLYVGEWRQAYPDAVVCACPGLERKRPDLPWDRVIGDEPEPEWRGEVEQVFFATRSLENEVVFFHRSSRTLICADASFNLASHSSPLTRVVAYLMDLMRLRTKARRHRRAEQARTLGPSCRGRENLIGAACVSQRQLVPLRDRAPRHLSAASWLKASGGSIELRIEPRKTGRRSGGQGQGDEAPADHRTR